MAAHRWLARVYLVCVGLGGLAGLYLSRGSYASNTFGIAFIALALAWLYTGTRAYVGGLGPVLAMNIVGWLCWVPNLLVVEAWLRRRRATA